MLDMYDFENDIWLCHSFGGKCYNYTAFQPAINVLKEIRVFLEANPSEIVTIFIEDYVTSPNGLNKVFDAADLRKYWFPVSQMPKNGRNWPTVDDMVRKNHRLLVFTSKSWKEAAEGIAYEWRYVVENQCESHEVIQTENLLLRKLINFRLIGCGNYRWKWWNAIWLMSKPWRITYHEHNNKVTDLSKLLS
uniref:PI-PLC X domain-containing protein n=1 Tax=Rhizophora mucronata TaxID=61149 RepID=A0A2P2IKB5_RHIMU